MYKSEILNQLNPIVKEAYMEYKARCVIEFMVTDYEKYLLYKEKGYKIYHCLDVLEFIKNERFLTLPNISGGSNYG